MCSIIWKEYTLTPFFTIAGGEATELGMLGMNEKARLTEGVALEKEEAYFQFEFSESETVVKVTLAGVKKFDPEELKCHCQNYYFRNLKNFTTRNKF